jgi:cysteinyl-tRNA synthetase
MALKYLGAAFDIHGGGIDLRFPHHENEQAQSRAAGHRFASYWVHNAWITSAGEKMSKSLGNSLSIPAVIQRVRPIDLRFYLVAAHYRSHVEFSFDALDEAASGFQRIEHFLTRARGVLGDVPVGTWRAEFEEAMDDDLGTPAAVAAIHNLVRESNRLLAVGASEKLRAAAGAVRAMLGVLGVDPLDEHWEDSSSARAERLSTAADTLISSLLKRRARARAEKNFAAADEIRDQLNEAGIEIEDTPQGPTWAL